MIGKNILQFIGNTPLIKLKKTEKNSADIYAKCEFLNVGASVKTRSAYNMIMGAKSQGRITKNTTIVEVSSGNQGISLAMICSVIGLKCVIVIPSSVSEERRKLILQYGATVVTVADYGDIGDCIKRCFIKADEIASITKNAFRPDQFNNLLNRDAHYCYTANEIIKDLNGISPHALCLGVGSGGTLGGMAKRLKEVYCDLQVYAVEPENASALTGEKIGEHLQMGIGDGIIPPFFNLEELQGVITVSDENAIKSAKELALSQGMLCGISSGSNFWASKQIAKKLGSGKVVLTLFADTGERYFSTPLFD